MPQAKFLADKTAIEAFFEFVFSQTDCRVYEAYSRYDNELRAFSSVADLNDCFALGADDAGSGSAYHFALWAPSAMPVPTIRRIALKKVKDGTYRYCVEGCGLFTVLLGGTYRESLTPSTISYWSEAGAKERCLAEPGPSSVNWAVHKQIGSKLVRRAKTLAASLEPNKTEA
jgi:hypothetical protein